MNNTDWINGLRGLADWLERNPDIELASTHVGSVRVVSGCGEATVEQALAFADEHAFDEIQRYPDEIDGVVREVTCARAFGPITVGVYGLTLGDLPPEVPTPPLRSRLWEALKILTEAGRDAVR